MSISLFTPADDMALIYSDFREVKLAVGQDVAELQRRIDAGEDFYTAN